MLSTLSSVLDVATRDDFAPAWKLDAASGKQGPRIVVLCADVDRLASCRQLVAELGRDCRAVLFDLVDCGGYEGEAAPTIFATVMEKSQVPIHLVALDSTASIANEIAATNYQVVNTVTIVDSSGTCSETDFRETGCHTLVIDGQDDGGLQMAVAVRQHLKHWFL